MRHILSTKKLSPSQRELLLNSGFGLVERNFISISFVDFALPEVPDNLIFTSRNAVKAILDHPKLPVLQEKKVFSVGAKTSQFLIEHGFKVQQSADYGKDLAEKIVHDGALAKDSFLFFCGSQRNPELPDRLRSAGVNLCELEVYQTSASPKKIDRIFDGVLFFSPSGVKSYCSVNDLEGSLSFCIGKTTASAAKKYTNHIVLASKPTIENVLVQVINYYKPMGSDPQKKIYDKE